MAKKKVEKTQPPFEQDDEGRFRAVLPCGKRPVIRSVLADKIRRVYAHFEQPEVPKKIVEIEGTDRGQPFDDPNDPDYVKKLTVWYIKVQYSLFERFVIDALVVPEDNEWAWKLKETGIAIPEDGIERQKAYVEEALEELVTSAEDRTVFIEAVRAISVPTEAGIREARRRFRDKVHGDDTDEAAAEAGESTDQPGTSGTGDS